VLGGLGGESLASLVADGVTGSGGATSGEGVDTELQVEDGIGMGAVDVATEVDIDEVVRCKAEDNAAEREATEPITDDKDVVGGVAEE